MNLKISLVLLIAWFSASSRAAELLETNALSLRALLLQLHERNPQLRAADAAADAQEEKIIQARAWEDPRAGFDTLAGRFVSVPGNSFTDQKFMLEQTIPVAGKNRIRARLARIETDWSRLESVRRELDLRMRARTAYFRRGNAFAQLDLNRKNVELLKQFLEISRRKFEVGRQSQADVLSAETELARLEETNFDWQRQVAETQFQLNLLLNQAPATPLGRPAAFRYLELPWSIEDLERFALTNRPDLSMARLKVEAAQRRLNGARREKFPDPNVRVEASRYNAASQVLSEIMVGVSVNLPWANPKKYSAAVREQKKMMETAEWELVSLEAETAKALRDQFSKITTLHHHYNLFRTKLRPLSESAIQTRRVGYETDRSTFLELISSQRAGQEIEGMLLQHLTDYLVALGELEPLVGISSYLPELD